MSEVKEIAAEGLADPIFFCRYFLHHFFPGPIPWVHRGLWAILTRQTKFLSKYGDLDKIVSNFILEQGGEERPIFQRKGDDLTLEMGQNSLVMLPRGFSKTTLAGVGYSLYDILYQISGVQLYTSATATHAETQLQSVQRELESNRRMRAVFGDLKPKMKEGKWTDSLFETTSGQIMAAKGRGSQVRGMNYFGKRPARIVFDDLEDKESVKTDEQRVKTIEWAISDLFPAIDEMHPDKTVVGLGTLLHQSSLLAHLQHDPSWTTVRFGARDRQGELLWKEKLNEVQLEQKKHSYALMGRVDLYYMEYFNEIRPSEIMPFRQSFFQYSTESDEDLSIAIFCDPAISDKKKADSSVIAVVGISGRTGKIFVLEIWGKRGAGPREVIDQFFRLSLKWKVRRHGIESNAYQAALVHLVREEMFRKKQYFEVEAVTHQTRNEERILGILQPRYASRYIYHAGHFPELEMQLLDFPNGQHDDYPVAVAGAIALLDPFAAHAAGDTDLAEDQFEPLDAMGGAP